MLARLPLYPTDPTTPLDDIAPRVRDRACSLCKLSQAVPSGARCGSSMGESGGATVLFGWFDASAEQKEARTIIQARAVEGLPVAWDAAVKCPIPVAGTPAEVHAATTALVDEADAVERCRGYLVASSRRLKPQRILALGEEAVRAVLGTCPPLGSVRRGYAYTAAGVPVFLLQDPAKVMGNSFARAAWADDVAWALRATPPPPPTDGAAVMVRTVADALEAVQALERAPWFAWDTETFGRPFDPGFRVLSVAAAVPGSSDAFVWDEEALALPEVRAPLLALLGDPDIEKAAMNGKYDGIAVRCTWGQVVRGSGRDIGLRRSLLDPEARTALDIQQWLVGMGGAKAEMERGLEPARGRVRRMLEAATSGQGALFRGDSLPAGVNLEHVREHLDAYAYAYADRTLLSRYNALDVVSTARLEVLHERALARPENAGLAFVWGALVCHATAAIEQMEAWGIRVSLAAVERLGRYLKLQKEKVAARLRKAGLPDPGSPDKVAAFLYDTLKLKARFETAGGKRSTAEAALEHLKGAHPAVDDLLEWRGLDKLAGTYCEGIRKQITADGRIHPDTRIDGARTGRMSMGGGLHGLPRPESVEGRMVRDLFVAEEGHSLLELDLSQAELRVLAGLSGDHAMCATFIAGIDIHQRSAEQICRRVWRIEPAQVEPKHRSAAKIINLALIYGKGDKSLAAEITDKTGELCTQDQAATIRAAILGEYKIAERWMAAEVTNAKRHGYARTYYRGRVARRRPLPALGLPDTRENQGLRGNAERAASNTPVQGSNADNVMEALIRAVEWILTSGVRARLVLTVHDSLLFEVHDDDLALVRRRVKALMEECRAGELPMVADEKLGKSYGSLKKPEKLAA